MRLMISIIDKEQVLMRVDITFYLEGQGLQVIQQGLSVQEGQQVPGHLRAKINVYRHHNCCCYL